MFLNQRNGLHAVLPLPDHINVRKPLQQERQFLPCRFLVIHNDRVYGVCLYSACMSINTIIVDDEKPAREELAFLLKGFPDINVIGQGKNGVEGASRSEERR